MVLEYGFVNAYTTFQTMLEVITSTDAAYSTTFTVVG
eukprot:CAMPEP_0203701234 /NCGR_PEP_ID=MMETSP0091-20130426/34599_1 /ASSEMBLY_ACC=CAM_ASM_001089 /TAXON_ID=426623 /ORGANISM="Chaetoceros affinis, Strain CCMP159" /LENGTH=36 /DNA_ID= /DNA_START= /DNA_END= /DNA_ORIENTATION=